MYEIKIKEETIMENRELLYVLEFYHEPNENNFPVPQKLQQFLK